MSQLIYGFLAAIVIPVIILFSAGYIGLIPQIKPFVVQSGSMEPSIKTGSVVFIQKSSDYKSGDVVAFTPAGNKNIITHRLLSEKDSIFKTKGDANEEADNWQITDAQIMGKVVLYIPYLGFGVDFVKHPQGFILLVIIPATIIIYEELKNIKAELAKIFRKLHPTVSSGMGVSKLMIIFPLLGLFLLITTMTGSYFLDEEKTLNNILGAANSFTEQLVLSQEESSQSGTQSAQLLP